MYPISMFISVMKTFKCTAMEAQIFLSTDHNKEMTFSSGEVYTPQSWNK